MWAAILLFGILLPILIIGGGVTFLWTAIAFMRRRSLDIRMSFSTVVIAYLALMMVIAACSSLRQASAPSAPRC